MSAAKEPPYAAAPAAVAQQSPLTLWYNQPAVLWTDALPVGNGQMGAMIFGGAAHERIQFNEDRMRDWQAQNARAASDITQAEERRRVKKFSLVAALVSVGAIVMIFVKSILAVQPGANLSAPMLEGETAALGKLLFTQYLLPFEVVSVLLLVAMVGVILLSKKDLK